jgi:hypothetical protein
MRALSNQGGCFRPMQSHRRHAFVQLPCRCFCCRCCCFRLLSDDSLVSLTCSDRVLLRLLPPLHLFLFCSYTFSSFLLPLLFFGALPIKDVTYHLDSFPLTLHFCLLPLQLAYLEVFQCAAGQGCRATFLPSSLHFHLIIFISIRACCVCAAGQGCRVRPNEASLRWNAYHVCIQGCCAQQRGMYVCMYDVCLNVCMYALFYILCMYFDVCITALR